MAIFQSVKGVSHHLLLVTCLCDGRFEFFLQQLLQRCSLVDHGFDSLHLNFKEGVISHILALISKLCKLLLPRYLSLKYVHSSTKFTTLEMTYWRNNLHFFVFSVYCIFSCDTFLSFFMLQVSN